jgi:hypothetical protein
VSRTLGLGKVTIALAVIAAATVAVPALGGQGATTAAKNPLKKLVKKEVAKQLKNKQGPAGPAGQNGKDGTALAGARVVGTDASFSPGTAFGGIEATKSAAGGYCIRVPFQPRNIQVSVESDDHNARVRLVAFGGGFGTCSSTLPGHQAWVTTHLLVGNSFSDSDFHILVN